MLSDLTGLQQPQGPELGCQATLLHVLQGSAMLWFTADTSEGWQLLQAAGQSPLAQGITEPWSPPCPDPVPAAPPGSSHPLPELPAR